MSEIVTPYKATQETKKQQVARMFNNIAGRYDFLNHFLSMGIDILWRKKAIRILKEQHPKHILDIATGTGDFAIEALRLNPESVTGIDISEGMLEVGREKIRKRGLSSQITLQLADSEHLPFADNNFDAITAAFGVRNFENLQQGLNEMYRVLKPGGTTIILEFSKPRVFPVKHLYNFYFKYILPAFGKMISKDESAYNYLPDSVKAFPDGPDFLSIYAKAGFVDVKQVTLSFGIASLYIGKK